MDSLDKDLKKLSEKERNIIKKLLILIKNGQFKNLDIKKLKGADNIFRVRKGSLRIILTMNGREIFLLAIKRRSDNTYKNI